MSDTQSAMREFRFLDEKRKTNGLTPQEEHRWQELGMALGIDLSAYAQQAQGYYGPDGNWYQYPPGYDPNQYPAGYDANQDQQQQQQQWDPNTQQYYAQQPADPNQPWYDPNTGQWYQPQPQAGYGFDPAAQQQQQQGWYDPNTGAYYPPQQPQQQQWGYDPAHQAAPAAPEWKPAPVASPAPAWNPPASVAPVQATPTPRTTLPAPVPSAPRAPVFVPPSFTIKPRPSAPSPLLAPAPKAPVEELQEVGTDDVMEIDDEEVLEIQPAADIAETPMVSLGSKGLTSTTAITQLDAATALSLRELDVPTATESSVMSFSTKPAAAKPFLSEADVPLATESSVMSFSMKPAAAKPFLSEADVPLATESSVMSFSAKPAATKSLLGEADVPLATESSVMSFSAKPATKIEALAPLEFPQVAADAPTPEVTSDFLPSLDDLTISIDASAPRPAVTELAPAPAPAAPPPDVAASAEGDDIDVDLGDDATGAAVAAAAQVAAEPLPSFLSEPGPAASPSVPLPNFLADAPAASLPAESLPSFLADAPTASLSAEPLPSFLADVGSEAVGTEPLPAFLSEAPAPGPVSETLSFPGELSDASPTSAPELSTVGADVPVPTALLGEVAEPDTSPGTPALGEVGNAATTPAFLGDVVEPTSPSLPAHDSLDPFASDDPTSPAMPPPVASSGSGLLRASITVAPAPSPIIKDEPSISIAPDLLSEASSAKLSAHITVIPAPSPIIKDEPNISIAAELLSDATGSSAPAPVLPEVMFSPGARAPLALGDDDIPPTQPRLRAQSSLLGSGAPEVALTPIKLTPPSLSPPVAPMPALAPAPRPLPLPSMADVPPLHTSADLIIGAEPTTVPGATMPTAPVSNVGARPRSSPGFFAAPVSAAASFAQPSDRLSSEDPAIPVGATMPTAPLSNAASFVPLASADVAIPVAGVTMPTAPSSNAASFAPLSALLPSAAAIPVAGEETFEPTLEASVEPLLDAEVSVEAPVSTAWDAPPAVPAPSLTGTGSSFDLLAMAPESAPRIPTFVKQPAPAQPPQSVPAAIPMPLPTAEPAEGRSEVFASSWENSVDVADEFGGAPNEPTKLATNSEFLEPEQTAAPSDDISIDSDPGEFVVENASLSELATNVRSDTAAAPPQEKLELASNYDFIDNSQLTTTGQDWNDDRESIPIEGVAEEEEVIQGTVLEEEPPQDSWGVAVSHPSPAPVIAAPPPAPLPPAAGYATPPARAAVPPLGGPDPVRVATAIQAPNINVAQSQIPGGPVAPAQSAGGEQQRQPVPVPGEHRVILHTVEGQVKRGAIKDARLGDAQLHLHLANGGTETLARERVKALFFMLAPGARAPATNGAKVRVTFKDGRQVAGFSADHKAPTSGFFVVPADNRTNTERIFIFRHAVQTVAVEK